jgi:hypothetical protein
MSLVDDFKEINDNIDFLSQFYLSFFVEKVDTLVLLTIREINRVQRLTFELNVLLGVSMDNFLLAHKRFLRDTMGVLKFYRVKFLNCYRKFV